MVTGSNHLYRQQPSPLLYSIAIRPARNSRLTQRETNHCITRCASVSAWSYLAGRLPKQLVIDLFAQHQRFDVCCLFRRLWYCSRDAFNIALFENINLSCYYNLHTFDKKPLDNFDFVYFWHFIINKPLLH